MREPLFHVRHKPPHLLEEPRPLIVACAPLRSRVNLSRIVRAAGCCGVGTVLCAGEGRLVRRIARDGAERVQIRTHRTLPPPLRELKQAGYRLVALEQTTASQSLYTYAFARQSVLLVGNERLGLDAELLQLVDDVVEIPMYGLPYSHNVATATAIALYEYCRQYPEG
jgi:tRNA G18 (ribose-2'-O)-methylase SpoU